MGSEKIYFDMEKNQKVIEENAWGNGISGEHGVQDTFCLYHVWC